VASGRNATVLRSIAVVYVALLVFVPLVVVTSETLGAGWSVFWSAVSNEQAVTAFRLTIETAAAAVAVNAVFGTGVALLLTRSRFPGRRLLSALVDLPISVSPIVAGLALILVYGPVDGWLGPYLHGAGIDIIFALPGMVLATAFVSLPLLLREVVPVLAEEGVDQEQAARVLGANGWQRFVRITVPTIRPALLYGIVLTLARSIGEFGAIRVVSGNVSGAGQTQTVPLLAVERLERFQPGAYQLAFILMITSMLTILVVFFRRESLAGA